MKWFLDGVIWCFAFSIKMVVMVRHFVISSLTLAFLAACAPIVSKPTATVMMTPPVQSPETQPASQQLSTPTHTELQPTPTPNIENMTAEQAAQAILEGKAEYPADWSDEKKAELAVAIAEYLNENVVADEAYVPMHFDEVGDIQVGWDPIAKQWRSNHNTPDGSLDFTGENLPELAVSGYTNAEGQEVIIDSETGTERVVPKINLPGLGEISITQLYEMGQTELTNYTVDLMTRANGIDDFTKEFIESGRNNSFALPVILSENAKQNDPIYHTMTNGGPDPITIPEAGKHFWELPTNGVLMPIFDNNSGKIIFWLRIEQGIMTPKDHSFPFSPGKNPTWVYAARTDSRLFGNNPNHSFAILLSGKTTADSLYRILPSVPFLENGTGIGDAEEVMRILNSGNTEELIKLLMELRLITLAPGIEMHQE